MIALPEQKWRESVFDEIDLVAEKTKADVSDKCDGRFSEVQLAVANNTRVTEKAARDSLEAIAELTKALNLHKESLALTTEIESAGKKGFWFVKKLFELFKWLGKCLGEFVSWAKGAFAGTALVVLLWAMITHHLSISDLFKMLGEK